MADTSRIIIIRCNRCKQKIYRYQKIGRGHILRCYKKRILEDHSVHEGKIVKCSCGNKIGVDKGRFIKMNVVYNV